MSAPDMIAEIAARYGAGIAPGVTVTRVPQGVSARPLPVWDGKRLITPDWKAESDARRRAGVKAAVKANAVRRGKAAEIDQHLIALREAGARPQAISDATGVRLSAVYRRLRELGHPIERERDVQKAAADRMIAARVEQMRLESEARDDKIRAMVARGCSEEDIGAALGLTDARWVRRQIQRAVPDFVFVPRRRGPKPKAVTKVAAKRAVHVARNADILARHRADETVEAIAAALGVTRLVVQCVLSKAGEVPTYAARRATARRIAELPDLLAQGMTTRQIAAHWGVTEKAVWALASRAGVSLRVNTPPPHNAGKVSAKVQARRQWVAAMVRKGATDAEMLRALGVHQSVLSSDIQALELSWVRRAARAARGGAQAGGHADDLSGDLGEGVAA